MRKGLIATFVLTVSFFSSRATHIAGGEMVYAWKGGNQFEITLKLYRDCLTGAAAFDPTILIGIFDKGTNQVVDSLFMNLGTVDTVSLNGPAGPCALPPEVCIEIGTYVETITIPDNPAGYYVAWERCCRNGTVVNIQKPLDTGFAFYMEMPDPALHNSSPVFSNAPLPFVCEGQPLVYSMAAADPDGDVLVYELSDPLAGNLGFPTNTPPQATAPGPQPGPYASIVWAPGYSLANVCGSNSPMTINAATGQMSVVADAFGLYAMAVTVREFRNGIQIGLVRREIEFAVVVCEASLPQTGFSIVQGTGSGYPVVNAGNLFTIYETDSLCLLYQGYDNTDSLWLQVDGELFPGGSITPPYATGTGDTGLYGVQSLLCWETACGHARSAPYYTAFTLLDNGCPLPQTRWDTAFILVKPPPVDSTLSLLCLGLQNDDSVKVVWTHTADIPDRYFSRYEIFRNTNGGPFSLLTTIADPDASSFLDLTATAHDVNDYCYFIRAVSVCGEAGLHSDTLCTVSQVNDKVNHIRQVSVTGDRAIEVTWKHFPQGSQSILYLFRKEDVPGAKYALHETLFYPPGDSWTDTDVVPATTSYCYYLINEDYCGNISPRGGEGCSIVLTGEALFHENRLAWSPYSGWMNGVSTYAVFRRPVAQGLFLMQDSVDGTQLDFSDDELDLGSGRFFYYVVAREHTGGLDGVSRSNEILLDQVPLAFLPSAFTPNGDGRNDLWQVASSYVKDIDIKVFSRWGELVFDTRQKGRGWDGTFRDRPVPEGTYVYRVRYTGYDREEPRTFTGTVTVVR